MAEIRPVSEQDVADASRQLRECERFHHRGGNGVPYFRLEVKCVEGALYPFMSTPDANTVLPVVFDGDRNVLGGWFLFQTRSETGGVSIKTCGCYCNLNEPRAEAAIRGLKDRLGIVATTGDLIECGEAYGYGDQYNFPVSCYVVTKFKVDPSLPVMPGCERKFLTVREMAEVHARNGFFGDETAHLVLTLLSRIQFPDLFSSW